VLGDIAAAGLRPVAVDLPGCGRSGGQLTLDTATVPRLAAWVVRFLSAVDASGLAGVAGHDIGGALAQRLLAVEDVEVDRLALVNSVTYDSWPVPTVARYRDPAVADATSVRDFVASRRTVLATALHRQASEAELADYLDPWTDARVARSWMALAGAADSRHTLDLVPALRESPTPKLLVWGEDDVFQKVAYAERFAAEMPKSTLLRVPDAGHIPMENDPTAVARALAGFFTG
jgi:pimeloyl-ACP methyl ester carboxylesterase